MGKNKLKVSAIAFSLGMALSAGAGYAATAEAKTDGAASEDYSIHIGGYFRTEAGFRLNDDPETQANDQFNPNMLRGTVSIDTDIKTGPLKWKIIGRFDREAKTAYLNRLEKLAALQSPGGNDQTRNFMAQYNTNNFWDFLREAYVDFNVGNRLSFRVGKQQLVWGESDFFQAMDVIEGFDLRWRLFFEDNEEWRKPNTMVVTTIDAPELNGNLQFFVRPGLDRGIDIGKSFNIEGGRWIPQPYRGVDFTAFSQYNSRAAGANATDVTGGIRWSGSVGSVGYSLAYIRTFNEEPVINPPSSTAVSGLFGVTHSTPYLAEPTNQVLGDWIYPRINVIGATANAFVQSIDAVLSTEVAFTKDKPFNYGQLTTALPGWSGITHKDVLSMMLRADKNIDLTKMLGTTRPSLSSLQLFDTWILGYHANDDIVEFASFGARKRQHTAMLTYFILLNYRHDTINPSFVIGTDVSNGGGFAIPAVEFVLGDVWRMKFEADLFWDTHHKSPTATDANGAHLNPLGISENQTSLFGWFHKDNQVVVRVTRQF
jgi:hypothetical protein